MRMMLSLQGALLAACLLLAAAGCRSGVAPLAPVHGKVTFRGQFLRGGTVVFTPDASRGGRGELAYADIQPDGSYVLRTGDAAGAAAGWHRVTVCSLPPPPATICLLPSRYQDPQQSGLSCEVKAGQPNSIDIHLD